MISTEKFINWLDEFIDYHRNINKNIHNLEKMEHFAKHFGNPEKAFNSIHIAGSKGKGSVSTMLAFILRELFDSVGLYTSPHVTDFRERISNAGTFYTEKEYSDVYEKIIAGFKQILLKEPTIDPGWFEIVTMTAFVLFAMQKEDWAIFETGMGGRLDMTNILQPKVCVLTPIELEHCQYLGSTISKIAFEKAGIIKKNTPVFCCKQEADALNIFRKKAEEMSAPFFYLPEIIKEPVSFRVSEKALKIHIEFNSENKIGNLFKRPIQTSLKLLDEVQAENAALATCTIKYIFPNLDEEVIETGLSKAWLPARFEILSLEPPIIIDGAHTEKSVALCMNTFSRLFNKKGILIFGCAEDKDASKMVDSFKNKFNKIIITIPGESKKSNIEKVYTEFKNRFSNFDEQVIIEKNADYACVIKNAISESKAKNIPLLITGSFYLAAEVKKIAPYFL